MASSPASSYDCSFKVLLIGDSAVGKSSLLVSFVAASHLDDDIAPTIGTPPRLRSSTPSPRAPPRRSKSTPRSGLALPRTRPRCLRAGPRPPQRTLLGVALAASGTELRFPGARRQLAAEAEIRASVHRSPGNFCSAVSSPSRAPGGKLGARLNYCLCFFFNHSESAALALLISPWGRSALCAGSSLSVTRSVK